MVENYLGPEIFRQGVHNYLAAHLYGNATAEDFWNTQTEVSHQPVDKIMDSFVSQPGEPMLDFGTPAGGAVSVSQQRFFLNPTIKSPEQQQWSDPRLHQNRRAGSGLRSALTRPERAQSPVRAVSLRRCGRRRLLPLQLFA